MADKSKPQINSWVFDYEYGPMWMFNIGRSYAVLDGPEKALAYMRGTEAYRPEVTTAPLESVVPLAMVDAWLDAHEADDDPEPDGFGTARQQAYRYLSHNGFDGTCACCGVDFTEYMP
jgi:hypothetical protein